MRYITYITYHYFISDAWDLPPMDPDGKADPYVEVSLRPGHKKFTTAIKTNSLNPTFNETYEFQVKSKEIEGKKKILPLFKFSAFESE